jgi:hypothetical protein
MLRKIPGGWRSVSYALRFLQHNSAKIKRRACGANQTDYSYGASTTRLFTRGKGEVAERRRREVVSIGRER